MREENLEVDPEMSDIVYTGSCYSLFTGRDFICARIRRTYEKKYPYEVSMFDAYEKLKSSALSESWDDSLMKALKWRMRIAPKGHTSHPDQDLITPEKTYNTLVGVCPIKMRELEREIEIINNEIAFGDGDEYQLRGKIANLNKAKSILTGIEIGSKEWIETLQ